MALMASETRSDIAGRRRVWLPGVLLSVAASLTPGCRCARYTTEAVEVPVIFRDAATGQLVNDCLLLRYKNVGEA